PVADIGTQYAERCASYFDSVALDARVPEPVPGGSGSGSVDVDDLLLQVMPDREKVGRLARLAGTLRYAMEGGDSRLVEENGDEVERVGRQLNTQTRAGGRD